MCEWGSGVAGSGGTLAGLDRGGEFTEGIVGARTVDGGRPALHQERDADRIGCFLMGGSGHGGGLSVRGDAPVAAFHDADRECDQSLVLPRRDGDQGTVDVAKMEKLFLALA